jgi:hypothetical protein
VPPQNSFADGHDRPFISLRKQSTRGNLKVVARRISHWLLLDEGASVKLHIGDDSNGIADWSFPVVPRVQLTRTGISSRVFCR